MPSTSDTFSRLLSYTRQHRKRSLTMAAVITIFCLFVSPLIPFNSDPTEYFPIDDEDVAFWLDMTHRFGGMDTLLVGFEEESEPFSFNGLVALTNTTKALEDRKADGILSARSLTNVSTLREGEDETLNAEYLVPSIPRSPRAIEDMKARVQADTQVVGALVSENLKGYIIVIQTDPRHDLRDIATMVKKVVDANRGRLKAYYYGAPFVANQVTQEVYRQLPWIVALFSIFLFAPLFYFIRRFLVIAVVLASAGLTLLWWLGLHYLAGFPLTTTGATGALVLLAVALLIFARGVEGWLVHGDSPFPFPLRSLLLLLAAAAALGAMSLAPLPYLANFGQSAMLGALTIALFGIIGFNPLMAYVQASNGETNDSYANNQTSIGKRTAAIILFAALLFGVIGSSQVRFLINIPELFGEKEEPGQALQFFNRHFGGYDFMQLQVKGDLRDPSQVAYVMALTDLLEGDEQYADVRSITQVIGYLARQFAGLHRIPENPEALQNLRFFLEGNKDVRPLISGDWDEAMITVRLSGDSANDAETWRAGAAALIEQSQKNGAELAALRLAALVRRFDIDLPEGRIEGVLSQVKGFLDGASTARTMVVLGKLKGLLHSPDSPAVPSAEEWLNISSLLKADTPDKAAILAEVSKMAGFVAFDYPPEVASELADMLLTRNLQLKLKYNSALLADKLAADLGDRAVPEAFFIRARGVIADLLTNRTYDYNGPSLTISGLPVILPQVENLLINGTWKAAFWLWLVMGLSLLIITRSRTIATRAALEAALATLCTFACGWAFGIQVDSASATIYLLPPLISFFLFPWLTASGKSEQPKLGYFPTTFAIALAAGCLSLLLSGTLPVIRLGAVMAISLTIAVLIASLSRRVPLVRQED